MENKATIQEFNRFLNIHEQLYLQTLELLKDVPDEVFNSTPIDNELMRLPISSGIRPRKLPSGDVCRET